MNGLVPRTTWPINPAPRAVTLIRDGDRFALVGVPHDADGVSFRPDPDDLMGVRVKVWLSENSKR